MKKTELFSFICSVAILFIVSSTHAQSPADNYVMSVTYTDSLATSGITEIQYYDGIGRKSVLATDGLGTDGTPVCALTEYDTFGRVARQWLPAVVNDMGITMSDYPLASQQAYGDAFAYKETVYDVLGRPTSICGPGQAWHSSGHRATIQYGTNAAGEVKRYEVNGSGVEQDGYYTAGALTSETAADEDGMPLTVFKDMLGNTVLERRYNSNDTYYVYDTQARLRYVLQPMYQTTPDISLYAFQYKYDWKGNCSEKKIPGCEPVRYWYDDDKRLAYMQDGNLRSQGKYRVFFYDGFGRMVLQAIATHVTFSMSFLTTTHLAIGTATICNSGYVMPSGNPMEVESMEVANYYDNYNFIYAFWNIPYSQRQNLYRSGNANIRGLKTGCATMTSDGRYTLSGIYYDDKGQVDETRELLPDDIMTKTLFVYTFTGNVESMTEQVTKDSITQTLVSNYEYYPSNDRLRSTSLSLNGSQQQSVAEYTYNSIGQVTARAQADAATTSYTYNIRGQLSSATSDAFSEWLEYNTNGASFYNGNIGMMRWRNSSSSPVQNYGFGYDMLNRLSWVSYGNSSGGDEDYSVDYVYNANGNITNIERYGRHNNNYFTIIDNLTCNYDGNRLLSVTDGAGRLNYAGSFDFEDWRNQSVEYEYDSNGNITKDINKRISYISYSPQNMPTNILMGDGAWTRHEYTSSGARLKSVHYTPILMTPMRNVSTSSTQDFIISRDGHFPIDPGIGPSPGIMAGRFDSLQYCGCFVYRNGNLEQVLFDGGYITVASSGEHQYHFCQRDHLGSVRTVVDADGNNEHTNEYYPYGGLFLQSATQNLQRYKYNGNELDRMHGLNLLDYGARWMDPTLGRFTTIDPMAEKYYNTSPYAYCCNNPVNAVDPDGRNPVYSANGIFIANTREGFTGQIYVYTGSDDLKFEDMTMDELLSMNNPDLMTYDKFARSHSSNALSGFVSNVMTHIMQQFDGQEAYGVRFDMSTMIGEKVFYKQNDERTFSTDHGDGKIIIYANRPNPANYEATVENLASSLIIHEWYGHGIMRFGSKHRDIFGNPSPNHQAVYQMVKYYNPFYINTTPLYKSFIERNIEKYKGK